MIKKICLGVIGFAVLLIVLGGLFSSTDNTTTIVVESDGSFSGAIGGLEDGERSIEGSGNENFTVNDTYASACIQKGIGNNGDLTVKIVRGGKVVDEQTTSAEYGVVTVGG